VAQGAGDPVVLVPGFLLRGRYLWPMQRWLLRLGYRAQIAGIGVNADCIDVMTDRLLRVVAGVSEEANGPVHLVGHSLGGLLARARQHASGRGAWRSQPVDGQPQVNVERPLMASSLPKLQGASTR
jgi:thioesterase domain-containing protein